ncbi:MAG: hypothetical protein A2Z16_17650 [Chloroflexi bacterium RBG_16_54_18]|nr:MAG: hypothetical protein A2Z16_17650 [Chloroflexi bacterium RBG_16_54_18]
MHSGNAALIAGVSARIAGLLAFLVVHHLWIRPIWFILPVGLVIADGGGLAVGWAYGELLLTSTVCGGLEFLAMYYPNQDLSVGGLKEIANRNG